MFSNSTKYALRAIVYMLKNGTESKYTVIQIARDLDIPQQFLSKIMQQLSRSNIISSTKGRGGGFYLSTEDMNRPMIDLIICIEGENIFKNCVLGLKECSDNNPCLMHNHFALFRNSLRNDICNNSIKNLLDKQHLIEYN